MHINMTTFGGRKRHYIHQSLRSLFSSDWQDTHSTLNLIMGSADETHVQEYVGQRGVQIVPWDIETHANLWRNCALNKIRALRHGDGDGTLICEDDILFPPHWFSALTRATAELGDEVYVLSLFAAKPALEAARLVTGKQWVKEYPTLVLQGAAALFYPTQALRNASAAFVQRNITRGCDDDLMGRYARAYASLYATRECLVENIGGVSCFH